jgi:hypothetical protein
MEVCITWRLVTFCLAIGLVSWTFIITITMENTKVSLTIPNSLYHLVYLQIVWYSGTCVPSTDIADYNEDVNYVEFRHGWGGLSN